MRSALLTLLLFSSAIDSALSQSAIRQDRVDQLVQQLASPSRRDREAAETELAAAGPRLLDQLPSHVPDVAVRVALERVRHALEQAAAREAGLPSTLTTSGLLTATQLADTFVRQTGQHVVFADGGPSAIYVDWKATPFWEAVHQLEVATGSSAQGVAARNALVFSRPAPNVLQWPPATSGPCRIDVIGESLRPNLVDPSRPIVQIRWRVRAEPRLRPLYLMVADRDCSLVAGTTSLEPFSPEASREIPCDRWLGCEIDTPFQVPESLVRAGLEFGVAAQLKVAALPMKLEFNNLHQPLPALRRRGGVTGVVRNVRFNPPDGLLSLEVAVRYDHDGPEFESHRMWIYQNAAALHSRTNLRSLKAATVEMIETGRAGATLRYTFENVTGAIADYEFVYEAPSLVIDVPFSVRGLKHPVDQRPVDQQNGPGNSN